MNQTTDVKKENGQPDVDAILLINQYIDRFSKEVSEAAGTQISFGPLDEYGFAPIQKGSATVGINVIADQGLLIFIAQIMTVPDNRHAELFQLLLELNYHATADAAFAIDKGSQTICLRARRSIAGLDYDEFVEMLHQVATVADEWDDRLTSQFQ